QRLLGLGNLLFELGIAALEFGVFLEHLHQIDDGDASAKRLRGRAGVVARSTLLSEYLAAQVRPDSQGRHPRQNTDCPLHVRFSSFSSSPRRPRVPVGGKVSAGGVSIHVFVHGHGGLPCTELISEDQGEDFFAANRSNWLVLAEGGKLAMIRGPMKMRSQESEIRFNLLSLLVSSFCLAAGCDGTNPSLVPVSGKVFYQNQPLPRGTIVFVPDADRGNNGSLAQGSIQAGGSYAIQTEGKPGAMPGWYRVTVISVE